MQSGLTTVFRKLTMYQFLNAVYDGDLTVVGYSLKARCSMQWSNPCTHVSDGAPSNFPVVTSHHFTRHANQWMMHVQASYCYRNHPPMSIPTHTQLLYVACMFCILQQLLYVFCIFQYYPQLLYVCVYLLYTPTTALCMCVCFDTTPQLLYVCVYVLYTPILPPNCSVYVCMHTIYSTWNKDLAAHSHNGHNFCIM